MILPRATHIRESQSGSKFISDKTLDNRVRHGRPDSMELSKAFVELVQALPEYAISMVYDPHKGGATIYWKPAEEAK